MLTALDTISTLLVSSSYPIPDIINSPNSTNIDIQAAGMTPSLKPTTASAVIPTDTTTLSDLSSSLNTNLVIYGSAALGGAALFGVSALLTYRRRRNKRQLALYKNIVPKNFQSMRIIQLSANAFLGGQHASPYVPNTRLIYRPTNGMQTINGPNLEQSISQTGWNGYSLGPDCFYPEQRPEIRNMSATAQNIHFSNLLKPSILNRSASYVGAMNSGSIDSKQNLSLFGTPTTEQPHNFGNTITVVSKYTMHF